MPLSVHPSHYLLLNQWAEYNQTCYMTTPHGKDVREQYIFLSIRHTISNISMERRNFAMACHQLHNLVINIGLVLRLFQVLEKHHASFKCHLVF